MALQYVFNLYFLLFFGIIFKNSVSALFSSSALYTENDSVVILNDTSLKPTLRNKSNVWLVQFYNSWCGHCIRFAPTWKLLAQDIIAWHNVINIGAIDCNNRDNLPVCREYDIMSFPTIKIFNIFTTDNDKGVAYSGDMSVKNMREAALNMVESVPVNNRPSSWPNLKSSSLTSAAEIWVSRPVNVEYVFLIFDLKSSYVGREVILDTQKIPRIYVLLVNRYNEDLIKEIGIKDSPALALIERNKVQELKTTERTRESFVAEIKKIVPAEWNAKDKVIDKLNPSKYISPSATKFNNKVYMADLESALRHSLEQEVAFRKTIKGQDLVTLKVYISILAKYFPGGDYIMTFLGKLNSSLQQQKDNISSDLWTSVINNFSEFKSLSINNWYNCRGSMERYRGYPCGVWMMFHSLTVQHSALSDKDETSDPLQVLHTMRDYIIKFFGCDECANNFRNESANINSYVNSTDSAILWLWETHNHVNARLAGDTTEDPAYPKVQFPTIDLCPSCKKNDQWVKSEVLFFLKTFYGKQNINMMGLKQISPNSSNSQVQRENRDSLMKRLFKNKNNVFSKAISNSNRFPRDLFKRNLGILNGEGSHVNYQKSLVSGSWFFSSIDISLCVVLYIVSSVILLFVYYLVAIRKKKRKYLV